jgi:hypothetical protein
MLAANLVEYRFCGFRAAMRNVIQTLTDPFLCIGPRGNVQQTLIPFSILHNGGCLSMHSQHDGALGPLQSLHEVTGRPPKRRQRLNVARNVQHMHLVE